MLEVRDHLDTKAWNDALASFPKECRDVNVTPEFHRIQVADGRGEPVCTYIADGDKRLLIPGLRLPVPADLGAARAWDLQSAMGFGGLVATPTADDEFIARAWAEWKRIRAAEGMVAAFFRMHPLLDDLRWLPPDARVRAFRKLAYADLTDGLEAAWMNADPAHRRQVKKGRRADLVVRWNDSRDLDEFEDFYNAVMRRKNAWADAFVSHEHFTLLRSLPGASLAAVREGDELAAAIMFIFGPCWVHYHQSVRAEDSPVYAHNCIVQAAIERAAEMGLQGVLLGGGITTALDDPLLVFKRRAGFRLLDYNIALVVADQDTYDDLHRAWAAKAGHEPSWLMSYRQPLP